MANDIQTAPEQSLAALASGIYNDVQELIKQQVALIRAEIRSDFVKTRQAVSALAIGVGALAVAAFLLLMMTVHLLHWAFPALPLWGCFGIVGGLLAVVGGILVYAGMKKFETFNPLPDESMDALRENLQWKTTPR